MQRAAFAAQKSNQPVIPTMVLMSQAETSRDSEKYSESLVRGLRHMAVTDAAVFIEKAGLDESLLTPSAKRALQNCSDQIQGSLYARSPDLALVLDIYKAFFGFSTLACPAA